MPLMVVGTGRSGTSAVAKMASEAGVFMGATMIGPNPSNPDGHWEDIDFRNVNQWRLEGTISPEDWRHAVHHLASLRDEPWGFKDPRTAHFLPEYRELLAPRLFFIHCMRPQQKVVDSLRRCYGWDEKTALELAEFRLAMLETYLPLDGVLTVTIEDLRADRARAMVKEFLELWLNSFQS